MPAAILAAAVAGGMVGGSVAAGVTFGILRQLSRTNPQELNLGSRVTITEESLIVQVAAKAAPAVVSILRDGSPSSPPASGFAVTRDGYLLTTIDAVQGAGALTVVLEGERQRHDARVVDSDCRVDAAVLKVDGLQDLPTLAFGDASGLRLGQSLVAVAGPLANRVQVAGATVSGLHRSVTAAGGGVGRPLPATYADTVQAEMTVDPGDSGDPVLNAGGQVVGLVMAPAGGQVKAILPAGVLQADVEQVIQTGHINVAHAGLRWTDVDAAGSVARGVAQGALVDSVLAGGPADLAGIRPGDVITQIDEVHVDAGHPLHAVLATRFRPSQRVAVTLWRAAGSTQVQLTLGGGHPDCR